LNNLINKLKKKLIIYNNEIGCEFQIKFSSLGISNILDLYFNIRGGCTLLTFSNYSILYILN
jgi:hypothetical protein